VIVSHFTKPISAEGQQAFEKAVAATKAAVHNTADAEPEPELVRD
jgi:hypothetical protein